MYKRTSSKTLSSEAAFCLEGKIGKTVVTDQREIPKNILTSSQKRSQPQ